MDLFRSICYLNWSLIQYFILKCLHFFYAKEVKGHCVMHLSFASPWVDPREPRRNGTVLIFLFFPMGERSCLVLETNSLSNENILTGFV